MNVKFWAGITSLDLEWNLDLELLEGNILFDIVVDCESDLLSANCLGTENWNGTLT